MTSFRCVPRSAPLCPEQPHSPVGNRAFEEKLRRLAAKAQGTLQQTPLLHQLVYGLDRKLTGSTALFAPDGHVHVVHLHEGVPAKARTGGPVAPLDRVLTEMGVLDEATLYRSLKAISARPVLHGAYLVGRGLIDRPTLLAALARQVLHKTTFMMTLPGTTRFAFYDGVNALQDYGGPELTPAEPLSVIMAGVRSRPRDPVVDQTLVRLGPRPLTLHPDADTGLFGFTADEQRVVDQLCATRSSLPQLLATGVAQERVVQLVIYALVITRCLLLADQQRKPVGYDPARPRSGAAAKERPARAPQADPRRRPPPDPAMPRRGAPSARGAEPLPRRGFATGRTDELRARRGTATGQGIDAKPRRSSPTGRGRPEVRPRRGTATGRKPEPRPRRGTATGRGAEPLPRRGTRSTGVDLPQSDGSTPAESTAALPRRGSKTGRPDLTPEEIQKRLEAIKREDLFEVLGLPREASTEAAQAAYFKLAKTWHPDRLPPDLRGQKSAVAKVFAKLNEAHRTLGDRAKRDQYLRELTDGGAAEEKETVARIVDSAQAFQKAEILVKRGALGEAEGLLEQCVEKDPEQVAYGVLLAWVQARRLGPPPHDSEPKTNHFRDQLIVLDQAIVAEPRNERALFYRAEILKQCGETERAIRDYRRAADLNPRNIEAKREVRIHDMRHRQSDQEAGLLGRLFKRKS